LGLAVYDPWSMDTEFYKTSLRYSSASKNSKFMEKLNHIGFYLSA